jgi:UDP-MurNAc hydroxylase
VIPYSPGPRLRRDLVAMGFRDIRELRHTEALDLGPGFRITSYHFHAFLDSALVIEADGVTLLNANDCKIMGGPLRELRQRHPSNDFVLRSHSSANSRLCYEIIDDPTTSVDDPGRYLRDFTAFSTSVGATWAIPFASNHCLLHRDVYRFNDEVITPPMVQEHFASARAAAPALVLPALQVMVPGDSWDDDTGFAIAENDWFERRRAHLEAYRGANETKLHETYRREERATIDLPTVQRYFSYVFAAMPRWVRRMYRHDPVLYVLHAGERHFLFEVDLHGRVVRELSHYSDATHPIQIHLPVAIMSHCMQANLFSHLGISKRVRYRVTTEKKALVQRLNFFFLFYEYETLPLRRLASVRFWRAWLPRWRELLLWTRVAGDLLLGRGLDPSRYLPMDRAGQAYPPCDGAEGAARGAPRW